MRIKNYTQKEYIREIIKVKYPDYWDEGLTLGNGFSKYREYRSWKYNRKTQYKL